MKAHRTLAIIGLMAAASAASAQEGERKIDPTFLHRNSATANKLCG